MIKDKMALIDSRGDPVDLSLLKDISDALIFATSVVCDPRQRRLCDWEIWIGERNIEKKS